MKQTVNQRKQTVNQGKQKVNQTKQTGKTDETDRQNR